MDLEQTDWAAKKFMASLPFDIHFPLAVHDVHLVHGSPRKVNEYLFEDKPASLYERLARPESDDRVLMFGHTHKPWIREYGGVLFVNCGSVGKPKDGDQRGRIRDPDGLGRADRGANRAGALRRRDGRSARSPKRGCRPSSPTSCCSPLSSAKRIDDLDDSVAEKTLRGVLGSAFLAAT